MRSKFKKMILSLLIMNPIISANAYVFSVTNGTNETIAVDLYGIGRVGGSLFQNKTPNLKINPYKVYKFHNTKRINNAGYLMGPQKIYSGHTVQFNFNSTDMGFCLNRDGVFVGLASEKYSMTPREVFILPSKYQETLINSISNFGGDIGKMMEALEIFGKEGKAISKVGKGIGGIISSIGELVKLSTCKNSSFVVIKDESNTIKITTQK